jgi:predicted  nucleic acid-binding Zn-ribbon protein
VKLYDELLEIEEMKERNNDLKDEILDYYKKNPKECEELLIELSLIDKEIENLEEEFKKLENEIY